MKILGLMVALGTLATNAGALATTAGEERVKECVNDYSVAESQPEEVIRRYCSCMTQKMGASGTKSVLEWEVSNTDATTACEKESGWKYPQAPSRCGCRLDGSVTLSFAAGQLPRVTKADAYQTLEAAYADKVA